MGTKKCPPRTIISDIAISEGHFVPNTHTHAQHLKPSHDTGKLITFNKLTLQLRHIYCIYTSLESVRFFFIRKLKPLISKNAFN